jgi:DNA-binding MarR family transcriptional regulator
MRAVTSDEDVMTDRPDPGQVAEVMFTCFRRMQRLIDAELAEQGLSLSRAKLLGALECSGPVHQSVLATAFDLAPRTITELVDLLERDGLVERRTDPADRRARQVHLTAAGRQAHDRAIATRVQLIQRVLGALDDTQLDDFAATLRRIDAAVVKSGAPADQCGTPAGLWSPTLPTATKTPGRSGNSRRHGHPERSG